MLISSNGRNYARILALTAVFLLTAAGGHSAIAGSAPKGGEPAAADASSDLEEQFRAAAQDHDTEKLLSLLRQHSGKADVVFSNGHSLLGTLAFVGEVEAAIELLHRGADPSLGSTPPLAEALHGIGSSGVSRSSHYQIIVELLRAGASYEFYFVDGTSFVEGLVFEVCEPTHFSPHHLNIFRHSAVDFALDKQFLLNLEKIKELARVSLKEPACVSFFSQRITETSRS